MRGEFLISPKPSTQTAVRPENLKNSAKSASMAAPGSSKPVPVGVTLDFATYQGQPHQFGKSIPVRGNSVIDFSGLLHVGSPHRTVRHSRFVTLRGGPMQYRQATILTCCFLMGTAYLQAEQKLEDEIQFMGMKWG
mgnify:CR=1 FL=1